MQQEIAYRFAATAVKGVSLEDTTKIVQTYLLALSTCQACNNNGGHPTGRREDEPCTHCNSRVSGVANGDPNFTKWICIHDESSDHCKAVVSGKVEPAGRDHTSCGPRVSVPIPYEQFAQGFTFEPVEWQHSA